MSEHLTIKELIKRKDDIKKDKQKKKQTLYISSLDANIVIEKPERSVIVDGLGMEDNGDEFLVYECVVEPNLKSTELHKEFEVAHDPMKIVTELFEPGEITNIAKQCLDLAGYGDSVKVVEQVKN